MMESAAYAYSTVELANSFDGRAAVYAVDYRTDAVAKLSKGKKISFNKSSCNRFKPVVEKVMDYLGLDSGCNIQVETRVPEDAGLGFDEAISSAVMLAVCGAAASVNGSVLELRINKYVREQVIEVDGIFVDMLDLIKELSGKRLRFDRLIASFYGGFIVADNQEKTILRRGEMESLYVSIIHPRKKEVKGVDESLYRSEAEIIYMEALKGNLYTAMRLNGLLYSRESLDKALASGALTATVNREGVVIALSRDRETAEKISGMVYPVANSRAKVDRKPFKIIKVNEFLKLKGSNSFYWI